MNNQKKQHKSGLRIWNVSRLVFPLALVVAGFSNGLIAGIYCSAFAGIILLIMWTAFRIEAGKRKNKSN
jgi:hypothetical protein